jgi:hypothetical protein
VRAQVLGYGLLAVARMHQLQPGQEVHDCEQGQEHQPEPEADEELLVEEVYWQGTLNTMLVYVVRHVSDFKVTKCHSMKRNATIKYNPQNFIDLSESYLYYWTFSGTNFD